jgi:uncharacterized membrane protein
MHAEELFFALLGLLGCGGVVVIPVFLIVLWGRVNRLRTDVEALQLRLRKLTLAGVEPAARPAATEADQAAPLRAPAAPDIEIAGKPSQKQPAAPRVPLEPVFAATDVEAPSAGRDVAAPGTGAPAPKSDRDKSFSLEEVLAGRWLTYVGALALIIGAGYFFKYAVDTDLIDENGRVAIGILAGMATFAGGAFAMRRNYRWLAQGLVGAAIGVLYFALFAAFDWYHIVPVEVAFAAMVLVTAAALAFSAIFNAQATALLGLIGGFLTPLMLSTGVDRQWTLFSYVLLLDLGVLGIASFRKWQPLQVTAFVFTLLMWLGWFAQHYEPAKLNSTLILMTAFFLLFALLGVWHNALRKLPARPGDYFLMLATPVVYFIGLYGVTKANFSFLHGLMAVGLAGTYLGLALFQMTRNPAAKPSIVCLAGVAASFLTVAVPLQLTGHWIAIAWAAEALLLVELGLRFGERKLRWAGFGLLAVVQVILFFYAGQTFDHPGRFDTRFLGVDPVAADVLPYNVVGAAASTGPAAPAAPSWTDVFNGRSFSFLASALVLAVLAWEYRRRGPLSLASAGEEERAIETSGPLSPGAASGWLLALVPLTVLGMLIVETFSIGYRYDWIGPTVVALFTVWTALAAVLLMALAAMWGPRWMERVGLAVFGLAAICLSVAFVMTLGGWRSDWMQLTAPGADPGIWRWPMVNPRGIGFLFAIGSAVAAAALVQRGGRDEGGTPRATLAGIDTAALLGLFAHVTAFALVTMEVYAQGVIRDWQSKTSLYITLVWTLYALAMLVAGIYYRSATVRILALSLFLLTTGKVFFYDVWHVEKVWRTLAFTGLGVALLLVSFLYRRFRERIRAWIKPAALLVAAAGALAGGPPRLLAAGPEGGPARPLIETLAQRWPLVVPADVPATAEFVRIVIPPGLYGVARDDLGDVRLLADDAATGRHVEVPFVLVQTRDSVELRERIVPPLNLSQVGEETQFLLDLGDVREPVNELTIDVHQDDRDYERPVTVSGADRRDPDEWALLSEDGYVFDVTRPGHRLRVDRVAFPRSQFRFYRIVIENKGQPALRITGARLLHREEVRAPRREYPAQILSRQDLAGTKQTLLLADVGHDRLPTIGVHVEVDYDGDYHRPVTVETTDVLEEDEQRTVWRNLASSALYGIQRPGRGAARQDRLDYGEARGRYLRLTIDNGDDQPLDVRRITALGIDKALVCEHRRAAEGTALAVYAGDTLLDAPRYDLARTIGRLSVEALPALSLGEKEPNPFFRGPTPRAVPWSEEHKRMLWVTTIAGVLIFGALTALLLWKTAQSGSGDAT